MTNAQTTSGPLSTITNVGTSLIRLGATVVTLPLNTVSTVTANLSRMVNDVATSAGNAVSNPESNDIVKAAGDLINATTGLYMGLVKTVVGGVEQASQAVTKAVNDVVEPSK
ncbi:hypothetical protein [Candidatus Oscillochloris fontis]|uniref:hypothetical protein n=1 Tax=Candidatus Oscillochloris fontis TaxID=2496868 RepID=UPI00101E10C8|nr:hypothetical protein [Candidatus Oscillochloris fontis]